MCGVGFFGGDWFGDMDGASDIYLDHWNGDSCDVTDFRDILRRRRFLGMHNILE